MKKRYEFNDATALSAVAVGTPGKRTFFLVIGNDREWVRTWLEKEQLQALAQAIDQFFSLLPGATVLQEAERTTSNETVRSGLPSAELEIDEIALGYDKERATMTLETHPSGPQELERVTLRCQATLAQLKQLGEQSKKLCAAGRPRCIICGEPIEPTGHSCPGLN